ncbi:RHS repeat-associated core domain-containing protein [Cysteiniphilum halobium]|uniref:RHS repeat-associated core domain-containing protein n=1 Tax=Cysteiniphilum halobium TaxID=2219059 RepID=UPI000E64D6B5|nr:RHS repeat-associated core domain-containing protein [Cysteiniphilum halobium]
MFTTKTKLFIGMVMSLLLLTQSMAYSMHGVDSINNMSVDNHSNALAASAIQYDATGDLARDNKNIQYSYNSANQLTQIKLASGSGESYYYYSNGLRAVIHSNNRTLVHYYSRHGQLLNSTDGIQSSAYLIANTVSVRSIDGTAITLLHNRHGSVIGQLSNKPQFYQYGVYGVQKTEGRGQKAENGSESLNLATNPLRYSGYMFDPLTGLYYLKARDYDPSLRSFMQADSYAFNSDGLINGYFYGNNNPLMGIDLSGHVFETLAKTALTIDGVDLSKTEPVENNDDFNVDQQTAQSTQWSPGDQMLPEDTRFIRTLKGGGYAQEIRIFKDAQNNEWALKIMKSHDNNLDRTELNTPERNAKVLNKLNGDGFAFAVKYKGQEHLVTRYVKGKEVEPQKIFEYFWDALTNEGGMYMYDYYVPGNARYGDNDEIVIIDADQIVQFPPISPRSKELIDIKYLQSSTIGIRRAVNNNPTLDFDEIVNRFAALSLEDQT